jgi:hypothetical protein
MHAGPGPQPHLELRLKPVSGPGQLQGGWVLFLSQTTWQLRWGGFTGRNTSCAACCCFKTSNTNCGSPERPQPPALRGRLPLLLLVRAPRWGPSLSDSTHQEEGCFWAIQNKIRVQGFVAGRCG